jgi:hypothetical protein
MGERESSYDKLNNVNWSTWKVVMKALLVKKNLWDVVSGHETLPASGPNTKAVRTFRWKQAEAIAEITLRVETPQFSFIQDDDPHVVWDALAAVHQTRGMAT